jgi:hypothetical protein
VGADSLWPATATAPSRPKLNINAVNKKLINEFQPLILWSDHGQKNVLQRDE